uniref:Uncharacterized protein n=1 Tax=Alexandrium monilatum TaxID=311494 RepID=A0A7S4W9F6_9DINO
MAQAILAQTQTVGLWETLLDKLGMPSLVQAIRGGLGQARWAGQAYGVCTPDTEMADAAAGDRLLQQCVRHSAPPPGEPPNEASRASLLFSHDTSSRKDQEEYAKKVISEAENGRDLLQRAEAVIMEDWLANTRALPGNVYRITAFGRHIGQHFGECSSMGWRAIARICGFIMVMLVQWGAPPAICMSTYFAWGIDCEKRFVWEKFHFDTSDWPHIALTKCLAMSLVFIFCLHSLYTVLDEMDGWHQVDAIFRYLQHHSVVLPSRREVSLPRGGDQLLGHLLVRPRCLRCDRWQPEPQGLCHGLPGSVFPLQSRRCLW